MSLWKRKATQGRAAPATALIAGGAPAQGAADPLPIRESAGSDLAAAARKRKRKQENAILDFLIKLAVFVLAIWAVFSFLLCIYQVNGQAMYPSIRDGDVVIANRLDKDYAVTDVVTYVHDETRRTARVVAMEGDTVEFSEDGLLMVNGNAQTEEVFYESYPISGGITYPYMVPQGSLFLLGDYRTGAFDSRSDGAIAVQDVEGKVITVFRRRGF